MCQAQGAVQEAHSRWEQPQTTNYLTMVPEGTLIMLAARPRTHQTSELGSAAKSASSGNLGSAFAAEEAQASNPPLAFCIT